MSSKLNRILPTVEKTFLFIAISVALLSVLVPLFIAILWSLVSPEAPWSYPDLFPKEISFDRWQHVWELTAIKEALGNSYTLAPIVATLCIILTLPTAYALGRFEFKGKNTIELISLLPMVIPGVTIALFFSQFLYSIGITNKFLGILLGHTLSFLPYSIRIISSAFKKIPQDQIDAARDLGANKFVVLMTAYMPLVRPSIFASFIFIFIRSIEEFNIAFILGSPDFVTVPTILYSFLGYNFVRPNAAVISLILVIPNIFFMFFIEKSMNADKTLGSGVKG